jgi:hypothetical protein
MSLGERTATTQSDLRKRPTEEFERLRTITNAGDPFDRTKTLLLLKIKGDPLKCTDLRFSTP